MSTSAKFLKRGIFGLFTLVAAIIVVFAIGVLWPDQGLEAVKTEKPIAITGVDVIDTNSGELRKNQTVLIIQGRIVDVGRVEELEILQNAIRVDGRGRYLMPALWDMHVHVFTFTPLLDMPLYIGYGVTNVRDMMGCPPGGDPVAACSEDKARWTEEALAGERIGPRIVSTTSFMANGPVILKRLPELPEFFGTSTPEQGRAFARYYAGKADALKVYDKIPRDAYFALVAEAKRLGVDVVGHRPHAISAIEAAENQKSIEHARFILHESFSGSAALRELAVNGEWKEDRRRMLDEHDPEKAEAIFAAMKRSETWYVPTHLTRRVDAYCDDPLILEDPLLRYMHPLVKWQWMEDVNKTLRDDPSPEARETYREFYRKGLELTGAAHQAGVNVLAGTDYIIAGATLHDELEQLVLAGLSPAEALRSATLSAAEYYGLENEYGRIAEGMKADAILLNENPLEDIRNTLSLEAVIFDGNLYDRNALDEISAYVENRAKSWSVGCKIIWEYLRRLAN